MYIVDSWRKYLAGASFTMSSYGHLATRRTFFRNADRNLTYSSGSFSHAFGFRCVYHYREERELYKGFAPPESEVTAYQGRWVSLDHIFYSTVPSQWENHRYSLINCSKVQIVMKRDVSLFVHLVVWGRPEILNILTSLFW